MRQSNSFSDGEIDLLEQMISGLTRGQRDLVHLVRHESFVALANKARTMGALSRGEARPAHAPAEKSRLSKTTQRVLEAVRKEPGKNARHYSRMVDRHRHTVCDALVSLMDEGKVERSGTNHETAYWPKGAVNNVVHLSERKVAGA